MTQHVPSWLEQTRTDPKLPDWLTAAPVEPERVPVGKLSSERRELLYTQYETVFVRVMEMLSGGYTLKKAFKELPVEVDPGGFVAWVKRDPSRWAIYKNAKELRTEAWADEIIRHAEGKDEEGNETLADTARSKLIVDTYWKLMGANNRKEYGDTKTIDMNVTSISITAALEQAKNRVIDATVIEDDVIDATEYQLLTSGDEDD